MVLSDANFEVSKWTNKKKKLTFVWFERMNGANSLNIWRGRKKIHCVDALGNQNVRSDLMAFTFKYVFGWIVTISCFCIFTSDLLLIWTFQNKTKSIRDSRRMLVEFDKFSFHQKQWSQWKLSDFGYFSGLCDNFVAKLCVNQETIEIEKHCVLLCAAKIQFFTVKIPHKMFQCLLQKIIAYIALKIWCILNWTNSKMYLFFLLSVSRNISQRSNRISNPLSESHSAI